MRLAAVRALGELGGDKARTDLQRLLIHEPETIRTGAILALAAAGDDVTVFASANDPSWQVRAAWRRPWRISRRRAAERLARQLLADRSAEVRRAVIDSLEGWSLGQSGPVLLTAMAEAPFATRKHAAEQLARRWPPALEFTSDAPNDRRAEQLTTLEETWRNTQLTGGEPWAIPMPPSGSTGEVAETAEQPTKPLAAHHQVLDHANPLVELFDQMAAEDVQARRRGAAVGGSGNRQSARRGEPRAAGRGGDGGNRSARVARAAAHHQGRFTSGRRAWLASGPVMRPPTSAACRAATWPCTVIRPTRRSCYGCSKTRTVPSCWPRSKPWAYQVR